MKSVLAVSFAVIFSGCSYLTQPASEAKARRAEANQAGADLSTFRRAAELEKKGLSSREATALAQTEARLSGRR